MLLSKDMEPLQTETVNALAPLKKVTPLSKYLAMVLFIAMPFIGGWIGYSIAIEKSNNSDLSVLLEPKKMDEGVPKENDLSVTEDSDQELLEGFKVYKDDFHKISFLIPDDWTSVLAAEGGQSGVGSPEYVAIFNKSETLRNKSGAAIFYDLYTVPEGFASVDEYIGVQKGNVEAVSSVLGGWQEVKTTQGYTVFVGKVQNPNSSQYLAVWGKINDRVLWLGFRNVADAEAISFIESISVAK